MRTSEWLAVGYFAYMLVMAVFRPLPGGRRAVAILTSSGMIAVVTGLPALASSSIGSVWRDWMPAVEILVAYRLAGLFFMRPMPELERRLQLLDATVTRYVACGTLVRRAPRVVLELLELAYLSCYVIVPLGLVVLYVGGSREHVDLYWRVVLLAGFLCYATLPWIQIRPPRDFGPGLIDARRLWIRPFNLFIIHNASVHADTIPSAHMATGLAAALAVGELRPAIGAGFLLVAMGIGAGSVAGRYHYAFDVVTGLAVAGLAWALMR